jgi:hypothetical protein
MDKVNPIAGRLDSTDGVRGLTPSYSLLETGIPAGNGPGAQGIIALKGQTNNSRRFQPTETWVNK